MIIVRSVSRHIVLEAKALGLQGLIPYHGDWDLVDIMAGLQALTDRKSNWPKHIIDQLPSTVKKRSMPGLLSLTQRQTQILKMIKERGSPNKVIANALNISESTVKLHVGCILKKYALTNRTQLALLKV